MISGMIWWHKYVLKHQVETKKVTVPYPWDSAKGLLHKCSCSKLWAQ